MATPILAGGHQVDVRSPHPFDLVDLREEQLHFQDALATIIDAIPIFMYGILVAPIE